MAEPKYELRQTCWRCMGAGIATIEVEGGEFIEDPCNYCGGSGYKVLGYLVEIGNP